MIGKIKQCVWGGELVNKSVWELGGAQMKYGAQDVEQCEKLGNARE